MYELLRSCLWRRFCLPKLSNIQIIVVVTHVHSDGASCLLVNMKRCHMRACEQYLKMAALVGIDVDHTISLTFVIGAALASVAGLMFPSDHGVVDFFIGFLAGVKAFTAAVLRHLLAAGCHARRPVDRPDRDVVGLLLHRKVQGCCRIFDFIIVLIFLPTGIFGWPEIEKV